VEVDYRQHPTNASTAYWPALQSLLMLYDRHLDEAERAGDVAAQEAVRAGRRAVRRTYGHKAFDAARAAAHERRYGTALGAVSHAIRISPAVTWSTGRRWVRARRSPSG
jgi:hypothetical protein